MAPSALRAGLAGLVDYAGLFPPASLDLATVVARFAAYSGSSERWMLGRLIVPLDALGTVSSLLGAAAPARRSWGLSVLVPGGTPLDDVGTLARQFNEAHDRFDVAIEAVELAAGTADEIVRIGTAVPPWLECFVELPLGAELPRLLDAVRHAGCRGKVRTGGVTADRIPAASALAGFVIESAVRRVPFKATAGLHHPLRNDYRLTYEPGSALGRMHGFWNLAVAAALVRKDPGVDVDTVCAVLEEREPSAFSITDGSVGWRGLGITAEDLGLCRADALRSVGSCSFEEPVSELRALGWLPEGV